MEIESGDHGMMVTAYHHTRSTTEKWIVPGVEIGLPSWPGQQQEAVEMGRHQRRKLKRTSCRGRKETREKSVPKAKCSKNVADANFTQVTLPNSSYLFFSTGHFFDKPSLSSPALDEPLLCPNSQCRYQL